MLYYAPLQVLPWSTLTIEGEPSKNIVMESAGVIGFLPIYDNLGTLKRDYPETDFITFGDNQLNTAKALQEMAENKVFIELENERKKREREKAEEENKDISEADKLAEELKSKTRR